VTVVQSFHRPAELQAGGVRFRFTPEYPWRAVAALRPNVIHVNGLEFPVHTRMLSGLGVPVLVQDHFSKAEPRPLLRRWGLARVAGAAFTDEAQAIPFLANASLPRGLPIFSVPESSTRFTPGNREAARRLCGVDGDPAVLWVGRLSANKDPLTALDAVEAAIRDLPGLKLWCCFHEAPLLPAVEARIRRSPSLSARVSLLGRRPHDEIQTLCRAADLFLAASHAEGSGYALIEAIACGAAPVVTDIPAFRRLVGDCGVLAPVGDAAALAAGLVRLAAKPAAELRAAVVSHFQRELSFARVGTLLSEAYQDLLRRAA